MIFNIFGSCVTRDIFDEPSGQLFSGENVRLYLSRASAASVLSKPYVGDASKISEEKFDDRRFLQDLKKRHFDFLKKSPADRIIVDLIDERHGLYVNKDFTLTYTQASRNFIKNQMNGGAGKIVYPHSPGWNKDYIIECWISMLSEFYRIHGGVIYLHCARYCNKFHDVSGKLTEFSGEQIEKNNLWNTFLDDAYCKLGQLEFIELVSASPEFHFSCHDHRWGVSPFHYAKDYYKSLKNALISML